VLGKIEAILKAAGSDKSKILMANVWLPHIADFPLMNAAWDAWVDKANMPARATVETRLAGPRLGVEIAVIAAV
jgi:enamine deaminase RidA (YjgF/YER057c/UK114 family)